MVRIQATRFASGGGVSSAQARAQFGANDQIDWVSLAVPNGAQLVFSTDPVSGAKFVPVTCANGGAAVVTHPLDLVRLTQGPLGGWNGNFPAQEVVLFTNDRPPPVEDPLKESIVIHFRQPVRGVGLQFQGSTMRPSQNLSFKANMVLWDLNTQDWAQPNRAVGKVNDPEAVFLGAAIANPMISTVQIYVDAMNGQQIDFAIGAVQVLR